MYKMSRNNCSLCTVILAILSTAIIPSKGVVLDCYTTTVSKYDGHQERSKDEQPCFRWDQFETYSASDFPDSTKSDAANFCRSPDGHNETWCFTTDRGDRQPCGITKCGDDGLSKCGQLTIDKPTILGRYVDFSFTPDTYDPNAILEWQRSMNGIDQWKTLPLNNKFIQYESNMIYHMILSDSEKNQDEIFYRVHYYNETSHCWMNAGKLTLEDTGNCGLVYLRSEKLIKNGTVEIEYYPSKYVMENSGIFERSWIHFDEKKSETLILANGSYEETTGQNYKYVLTIYMFRVSMNGQYSVYCGQGLYTHAILLKLSEPPSTPVIVGLQDIEKCRDCIVGEDNDMFELACEIHGGTTPLTVTMTIGNETYQPQMLNSTTYMVLFLVKDHHHMENVIFSVKNVALSSPLSVTAQMFVIKPPNFHFLVPEILRDGGAVNITCMLDDGRPNPNVYFSISGSEVSSANSHYYNSTTSLNTNIITLTTFKKEWNKENITCCRYNEWYKLVRDCSPPKQVNYLSNPDGAETSDNICTAGKNETGVGLGAVIGFVIAAIAVGILIGVICTLFILTRKRIKTDSKTQPTVSHEIELTGPPTALDTYEQLQNRTDTEIRGTYDSLEVNSRVQQNSESQYESLNQEAEKYHTYTDLKQIR